MKNGLLSTVLVLVLSACSVTALAGTVTTTTAPSEPPTVTTTKHTDPANGQPECDSSSSSYTTCETAGVGSCRANPDQQAGDHCSNAHNASAYCYDTTEEVCLSRDRYCFQHLIGTSSDGSLVCLSN